LEGGDELSPTIQKALDDSCAVIIVLTDNVNKQPEIRRYYKKEWNYVVSQKPKDIYVVHTESYNGWTLHDNVFTKEVQDNILGDAGDLFIPRIKIGPPDYLLSSSFLTEVKSKQYKMRISGL
jgi:hypothetical protein